MVASLSRSLKLRHLLGTSSRQLDLNPHFAAFSTSHASLSSTSSSSTLPQSTPSQPQETERGAFSKLLLFLPGAITFGLGTWQLFRRQEKIEMVDYRRRRLDSEPITSAELPFLNNSMDSLEFRRVVCDGDFDEKRSVFVGPRSRSISGVTENGYFVITPFNPRDRTPGGTVHSWEYETMLDDLSIMANLYSKINKFPVSVQTPILVNRGWVPRVWRDRRTSGEDVDRASSSSVTSNSKDEKAASWWNFWSKRSTSHKDKEAAPPVKVVGVIRGSEKPSIFVPPNDPDSGQWFSVDVPMIARACGLPENTIYIEEIEDEHTASAKSPYPVPKDINTLVRYSVMPQDHLNYTATWYTLSAAVTFMAVKRIKAKKVHL